MDTKTGIWTLDEARRSHFFDEPLAAMICNAWWKPDHQYSIADLGCGRGAYAYYIQLRQLGRVTGYEGTPGMQHSDIAVHSPIYEYDLSKPRTDMKIFGENLLSYGLVLCLEVGEHIPKEHEQNVFDNVSLFVADGGDLILSWAIPGQGGVGHVNEQPNDYVIEQMQQRGFTHNKELSDRLRDAARLPWFKNTLMVFRKDAANG